LPIWRLTSESFTTFSVALHASALQVPHPCCHAQASSNHAALSIIRRMHIIIVVALAHVQTAVTEKLLSEYPIQFQSESVLPLKFPDICTRMNALPLRRHASKVK
jgi:hypothetical protein